MYIQVHCEGECAPQAQRQRGRCWTKMAKIYNRIHVLHINTPLAWTYLSVFHFICFDFFGFKVNDYPFHVWLKLYEKFCVSSTEKAIFTTHVLVASCKVCANKDIQNEFGCWHCVQWNDCLWKHSAFGFPNHMAAIKSPHSDTYISLLDAQGFLAFGQ